LYLGTKHNAKFDLGRDVDYNYLGVWNNNNRIIFKNRKLDFEEIWCLAQLND